MTAKDELLNRLEYLSSAKDLSVLIDNGIVASNHNGVANLLRKGLGIVAFNILEDFIKKRTAEALATISSSGISFAMLMPAMQEAAILDALSALTFRARIEKKDGGDWRTLIQDEASKIYSTKNPTFSISPLSFASSNSNVTAQDVTDILAAFGVKGGWAKMKSVSDSISGGLPDLSQAYKNAAERRHSSAHAANFVYDYQWLVSIKDEILAISASLDILLDARCRQISSSMTVPVSQYNIDDALNYRFLVEVGAVYKESKELAGTIRKNWTSLVDGTNHIRPNLRSKNEFLIVLDARKRIKNWYVA